MKWEQAQVAAVAWHGMASNAIKTRLISLESEVPLPRLA